MLLYKGGGRLPTAKLYERMVLGRLEEALNRSRGISIQQHGFRKGSGAIEAIKRVVEFAEKARKTRIRERITSTMLTLDVKNAFNSAAWDGSMRQ